MQRLWCRLSRASCATACTSQIKLGMGPTHYSQLSKEIEGVDCVLQAYHFLSLSLSLSVSDPKNAEVSGSHNKSCRHSENHSITLEAFGSFFGSEVSSSSSSAILHCG